MLGYILVYTKVSFMKVVVKLWLVDSQIVKIEIVSFMLSDIFFTDNFDIIAYIVEKHSAVSVNPYLNFIVIYMF